MHDAVVTVLIPQSNRNDEARLPARLRLPTGMRVERGGDGFIVRRSRHRPSPRAAILFAVGSLSSESSAGGGCVQHGPGGADAVAHWVRLRPEEWSRSHTPAIPALTPNDSSTFSLQPGLCCCCCCRRRHCR